MKNLLAISTVTLLITGCVTMERKTATAPISQERANMIVDGKTTKIDLLSMFGNPNGLNRVRGMSLDEINAIESEIMTYKDCVASSVGSSQLLSFMSKGRGRNICKVFTALLNKNDIVIAHKYTDDNFITQDKLSSIKPNQSTKKDVIRTLAGPTSITPLNNKNLYIYKTCIMKSKAGGFMSLNISQDEDCQQATIVLDKKTNIVSKVNFVPFMSGYDKDESAVMMSH